MRCGCGGFGIVAQKPLVFRLCSWLKERLKGGQSQWRTPSGGRVARGRLRLCGAEERSGARAKSEACLSPVRGELASRALAARAPQGSRAATPAVKPPAPGHPPAAPPQTQKSP